MMFQEDKKNEDADDPSTEYKEYEIPIDDPPSYSWRQVLKYYNVEFID